MTQPGIWAAIDTAIGTTENFASDARLGGCCPMAEECVQRRLAAIDMTAATIREQLRAADIPCRYGGDEFCLLLPQTGMAGARTIAERIRTAVATRAVQLEQRALRTTVSIGLAVFPQDGTGDLRSLIRKADEALYRAKGTGRDRVVPFAA